MFTFRSLYWRLYSLSAIAITLFALLQLLRGEWQWLAPLLAWAPLPLLNLWRRFKANVGYLDERERPVMTLTLIAVAMVLVTGERDLPLWFTLAGLFGLLLFLFVASALPRGLREQKGRPESLSELEFRSAGEAVSLQPLLQQGSVLVLFLHSGSQVYSRMALRELQQWLEQGRATVPAQQIVALFPGQIPSWSDSVSTLGVNCWQDSEGSSLIELGLWLRGGNAGFTGGAHAARPALAVLQPGQSKPQLWQVANNYRLPPSLTILQPKIDRLVAK